jgi:hypothetical protein
LVWFVALPAYLALLDCFISGSERFRVLTTLKNETKNQLLLVYRILFPKLILRTPNTARKNVAAEFKRIRRPFNAD